VFGPIGDQQDVLGGVDLVDSVYAAGDAAGVSTITIQPNMIANNLALFNVISSSRTDISQLTWSIDNTTLATMSISNIISNLPGSAAATIGYVGDPSVLGYNDIMYTLVEGNSASRAQSYSCTIRLHNW
jgi:hypothetical protein